MGNTNSHTEKELFAQLAKGDPQVFRRLLYHYRGRIFGQALAYLKNTHKAEDIVQDVFMTLWTQREKLTEIENPEGYLLTIARNKIITELRKRIAADTLNTPEEIQLESSFSAYKGFETNQTLQIIQSAIDKLPSQQKKVFQLTKQQGLSYDEVASQLGISRETVKAHMVKALSTLRMLLRNLEYLVAACSVAQNFFYFN